MKLKYLLAAIILVSAHSPSLRAQEGFDAAPVLKKSETISGQPIGYPITKNPEVSSVLVTIKAGGESGRHKHPVSPHIYVIEGQVTIEFDDGKRQRFKAGEAFLEAVDTWHNAKNLGKTPVKMLVVFFGEKGQKNLIRPW